jgi:hypothetical protein
MRTGTRSWRKPIVLLGALALGAAGFGSSGSQAAENAVGFYLLGTKGSMAGFVPPPGTYFIDVNYYYAGDASGSAAVGVALRRLGNLTIEADVNIDANAYVNMPSVLWVAPGKVLGGNVGFGAIVPVGRKSVDVDLDVLATLTLPPPLNRTLQAGRRFNFEDSSTEFGDPILNALIGWHQGNWHWNIGTLVNVPIGPWSNDSIRASRGSSPPGSGDPPPCVVVISSPRAKRYASSWPTRHIVPASTETAVCRCVSPQRTRVGKSRPTYGENCGTASSLTPSLVGSWSAHPVAASAQQANKAVQQNIEGTLAFMSSSLDALAILALDSTLTLSKSSMSI